MQLSKFQKNPLTIIYGLHNKCLKLLTITLQNQKHDNTLLIIDRNMKDLDYNQILDCMKKHNKTNSIFITEYLPIIHNLPNCEKKNVKLYTGQFLFS